MEKLSMWAAKSGSGGSGGGSVTGVKGNEEDNYRTGNVNITKENIGLGSALTLTSEEWTQVQNVLA